MSVAWSHNRTRMTADAAAQDWPDGNETDGFWLNIARNEISSPSTARSEAALCVHLELWNGQARPGARRGNPTAATPQKPQQNHNIKLKGCDLERKIHSRMDQDANERSANRKKAEPVRNRK